jgi:hypothetical protein
MLRRLVGKAVLPVLGAAAIAACHTFGPIASPRDFLASKQPARIWVTETDGSVAVFEGPKLVGDTLAGFVRGEYQELPLSNVKQIAARQSAPRRTRFSIIAGSIATIGVVWLIAGGGFGNGSTPEDEEDGGPPPP